MRKFLAVAAVISTALSIGGAQGRAQQTAPADSNPQQPVPDAPPPQKKPPHPAAKPSSPSTPSAPSGQSANQSDPPPAKSSGQPHSASEDNPFPEDVSRKAAQAAGNAEAPANSSSTQSSPPSSAAPHSSTNDNPFPEDVSRKAAQAAAKSSADTENQHPEAPLSPGESSSASSSLTSRLDQSAGSSPVADPARAKEDTQVGDFYLAQGDYKGAYLRYQDAMKFDPANIDAIFGTAEAARGLGKIFEAARNYQTYLEIEPTGSKAKRALKALNALSNKN